MDNKEHSNEVLDGKKITKVLGNGIGLVGWLSG